MSEFQNKYRIESNRLKEFAYTEAWWYYITICVKGHQKIFGEISNGNVKLSDIGKMIREEWIKTKLIRPNIDLDEFVIMPNHIHGIIIIDFVETTGPVVSESYANNEMTHRVISTTLSKNSLGSIIGQFKSVCTKRIRKMGYLNFAWQSNYYDHIIRNQTDLDRIRKYIQLNLLKWELDEYYSE